MQQASKYIDVKDNFVLVQLRSCLSCQLHTER